MPYDLSIAILCGGKSKRFGTDKAQHIIGGKPMYRHILDKVSRLSDDIFLQIGKSTKSLDYRSNKDVISNKGPLGGIYSALTHASHDRVFVVACDMPFLDIRILNHLIEARKADMIVPRWRDGRTEPTCAIFSKKIMPIAKQLLDEDNPRISDMYARTASIRYVSIEELVEQGKVDTDCFVNINEPKDIPRAGHYSDIFET